MAYTHFRYIGYQVPTVGYGQNGFLPIAPGDTPDLPANDPVINEILNRVSNQDARCRLARLYMVLLQAYQAIQSSDNSNVLKVFLAPEFYFRPYALPNTSDWPAYSYTEYQSLKFSFSLLMEDTRFNDWLIIPGSIMWQSTGTIGDRPDTQENVFFNTAICKLFESNYITNEKVVASHIDGLPTKVYRGFPGNNNGVAPSDIWTTYSTQSKKRKHIFNFNGINCGMEICLEHALGVLKKQYSVLNKLVYSTPPISLQLLVAGGMPIEPDKVAAIPQGYILRTDGLGNGIQVELRRANSSSVPVSPQRTVSLPANLQLPDPGCRPGYFFAQELHIYNPLPLAQ
ncbi:hypothetical protein [Chitinophaga solisilvae]|uniref:hypothetical protein n=1 Tax=Chitinophaga solisilvae TaxID=1233460 RepID=UPI001372197B|nr:hypothetical protein [Chitinophaga solisilvae]